jgi:hypothetical protein
MRMVVTQPLWGSVFLASTQGSPTPSSRANPGLIDGTPLEFEVADLRYGGVFLKFCLHGPHRPHRRLTVRSELWQDDEEMKNGEAEVRRSENEEKGRTETFCVNVLERSGTQG